MAKAGSGAGESWEITVKKAPAGEDGEPQTEVTVADHTGSDVTLTVGEAYSASSAEEAAWVAERAGIQCGADNVQIAHEYPGDTAPTVVPAQTVQESVPAASTQAAKSEK